MSLHVGLVEDLFVFSKSILLTLDTRKWVAGINQVKAGNPRTSGTSATCSKLVTVRTSVYMPLLSNHITPLKTSTVWNEVWLVFDLKRRYITGSTVRVDLYV